MNTPPETKQISEPQLAGINITILLSLDAYAQIPVDTTTHLHIHATTHPCCFPENPTNHGPLTVPRLLRTHA